jgi:hypothetical protein
MRSLLLLVLIPVQLLAQRKLTDLVNTTDSAWPLILEMKKQAKNKVDILPIDNQSRADNALLQAQVTTRSPMGAIAYHSGGILIDNGWLRILGSGSVKLNRELMEWNKGKTFKTLGERTPYLLVADDAVGGFFAINAGGLGKDMGKLYYLSPRSADWEALDISYSQFMEFCFNGDLAGFYKDLRWKSWQTDVGQLDGHSGFSFYPTLWTKEGRNLEKISRKAVPIEELYGLLLSFRKQLLGKE